MAHLEQSNYVKLLKRRLGGHFVWARVLEVGSLDINGSIRSLFKWCDYTGIDVAPGPGVDEVCQGQEYDAPSFDTVISCEVMEHNPHWAATMQNMLRLAKPGGLVIMTCATTGRPEHGTPQHLPDCSPLTLEWNYYRNLTEQDFRDKVDFSCLSESQFEVNEQSCDLYFYGIKGE